MDDLSKDSHDLLTISEAADMLRLRPSTLRAWRHEHRKLPFVKFSRRVFVRRSDVTALVAANIVPTQETRSDEA